MPRRTPLFDLHHREGAKFVEFAGWELPLHFGSILEEAKAVRSSCGMFDVSHMGRIGVQACKRVSVNVVASAQANGVAEKLDWLVTMDVKNLAVGQVRYGFLCNERGGIIDDLTVARLGESEFLLVVNASRREVDFAWMRKHLPADVEIVDRTFETAMIAVQGPDALEIVDGLVDSEEKPSDLKRFRIGEFTLLGTKCLVSRTGYTGEDGVEIVCPSDTAGRIWSALRSKGVRPCGLGARDILRLEAGMCLYGHDLDEDTTPAEADLMRFVVMEKTFVGRDAIEEQLRNGIKRKRVGLRLFSRTTPREGAIVLGNGQPIGKVTSGVFSPHLNTAIAMAYVETEWAKIGQQVQVLVRDKPQNAEIVATPFLPLPSRKEAH
ncbi:glycine cleavage system aminomethyltransferase GcvT [Fervidibacter sacchari]|uniref:Aminomethyltransferase n=1 Tax=Candidatus Fervidibacter sacchari TaxID=1448929 RepID=A0ABT2EIS0_9BACT|nr:glycine cleavage system aminomethyltransferase GcvT [Candidatus Fervidibacter sacchari]MCS3917834.1 aminomethyltransferase [Candidatus Fervidibacter sacchari]WKU15654.1 glycine cleavage system aminomethyltransferase GcvT [Candidatus Fervidibacter sacchari]